MRPSLRQRLLAVLVLAAVACGAALVAILQLARTTHAQRTERAHESVIREVDRLRDAADVGQPWRALRVRRVQSGYIDRALVDLPPTQPAGPHVQALRTEAARAVGTGDEAVVREGEIAGGAGTVVIAVAPLDAGGYAWAVVRVLEPKGLTGWRAGVLVLALATLGLVVLSVATLAALERGARSLRGSLEALAGDLTATVARPGVRELDAVAGGIESLAGALIRARADHEALTRALAERERLAALGRVAAGVAHEVRNPLAAIKLRVDLTQRALAGQDALVRDLGEVSSEIARLDRLVADLLVVAGRRTGPRRRLDLADLARSRCALLAPWVDERGVTVAVTGSATAVVDADAVARVVDNLLRNAAEAVAQDDLGETVPVTVTVTVTDGRASAVLTVEDGGPGVPAGREGELFEPFFTTKPEGTGLGLALSRSVAEAHGGTLTYHREGGRTRFVLRLPAIDSVPA